MTSPKLVLAATLLAIAVGCTKNRTEIVLGMATDLTASTPLSSVHLQVFSIPDDVPLGDQLLPISGTIDQVYELPGTYAVYSASGSPDRFRALLTASDPSGATLVVRSAVLSLVPGKTLFARLGLVSACEGMTDCGPGETCIEGRCTSEEIDSSRLPQYTPGMETEVNCASATTFVDTSTKQPLKVTGTSCAPGGACLEGVCLTPPPIDGGGGAEAMGGNGGAAGTAGNGGAAGMAGHGAGGGQIGGAGGQRGAAGAVGTAGNGGGGIGAQGGAKGQGGAAGSAGKAGGGGAGGQGGSSFGGAGGRGGAGGLVGADASSVSYPLLPDSSGSIMNNGAGIVGAWFSVIDGDLSCLTDGAPICSTFSASSPAQGTGAFGPSDLTTGKMCAAGTAAQVVTDTASPTTPDYAGIWGAVMSVGFNQMVAVDGGMVFGPYDATAHGIVGFSFDVDNVPPEALRVLFTTASVPGTTDFSAGSLPAFWEGATSGNWPVVSGSNVVPLSQVGGPFYLTNPPAFDPSKLLQIEFQVVPNTNAPLPFNFCISNLTALTGL